MSCSRTAVRCETRTSPGFIFDNESGFSFDTPSVWAPLVIRAVPFGTRFFSRVLFRTSMAQLKRYHRAN